MKKIIASLILSSLTASVFASTSGIDVIYGEDNRMDVFEARDNALVELSKSTAAMIAAPSLKTNRTGTTTVFGKTLESRGICASERFSQQISAANCSGFLVAPNILVTAGHCIKSQIDCTKYKWVFDYKVTRSDQGEVDVPTSSVYSCKSIIATELNQVTKEDYAVITLDRNVTDRAPLSFRKTGKIRKGTSIAVIGHPTGLPTKITDGAKVRSLAGKFFVGNLDTYGGNSGSAVFNTKTGQVEGILVRGENDYVYDSAQGCQVSNVCDSDGCRGEDVTYITNIEALKNL